MNIEELKNALTELGFEDESYIDGPTWSMVGTDGPTNTDHTVHYYSLDRADYAQLEFKIGYERRSHEVRRGESEESLVDRFLRDKVLGSATVADVLGITQDRINNTITKLQGIDPRKQLREDVCDDIEAALTTLTGI